MAVHAEESGKQWKDFLTEHISLSPAFERLHAAHDTNIPYRVSLRSIEGILIRPEIKLLECQLYVSLYDLAYHQFFGRQWQGPKVRLNNTDAGRQRIAYNQFIYFHTTIKSNTVVAVVELVAIYKDSEGKQKKESCGWGILRFFPCAVPDASQKKQLLEDRIKLYYGTPRALYLMDDSLESDGNLKVIPECYIAYTISIHKALFKILHLLPENVICGKQDIIPGVFDDLRSGDDLLHKPKTLPTVTCQIDNLSVVLPPNMDKFEEEFCQLLMDDHLHAQDQSGSSSGYLISERRLKIGVHNGWCYVGKQLTVHLDLDDDAKSFVKMSPTTRRARLFTHRRTPPPGSRVSRLIQKNAHQITGLVEDPLFAVVFALEYVVVEPVLNTEKLASYLTRASKRSIVIRWVAWQPFSANGTNFKLSLIAGPCPFPDEVFVYKSPATDMQDEQAAKVAGGTLMFQGFLNGKHIGMQSLETSDAEGMLSESQAYVTPGRPPRPKTSPISYTGAFPQGTQPMQIHHRAHMPHFPTNSGMTTVQQLPMSVPYGMHVPAYPQSPSYLPKAMSNFQPIHIAQAASLVGDMPGITTSTAPDLQELPFTPVHIPIMIHSSQISSGMGLSRAAYAKLYSTGFPPLKDRNGDSPEVLDPYIPVSVNLDVESKDSLCCNEIVFQFLAFSKILSYDFTQSGKNAGTVFFTFQFYRYPPITTERLLLAKPESDLSADDQSMPFILHKLDKDGSILKGPPGYEVRYFVDPGFLKPGENCLFLKHLSQQILHIDVWDGDSLILLGSSCVELKYLCRQGREAVQTLFELDVLITEYLDESGEPKVDGKDLQSFAASPILKGHLHLRLANIGNLSDCKDSNKEPSLPPVKTHLIVSHLAGKSAFQGGSLTAGNNKLIQNKVSVASNLLDNNLELSALLVSQRRKHPSSVPIQREADAERKRKLDRMTATRKLAGTDSKSRTLLSQRQDLVQRARDMKTLNIYRLQTKKDGIVSMLNQAITTEHVLHPSFGTAEFFEFVIRNPYNSKETVCIEYSDPDLCVITDAREWRHYKQLTCVQSPVEEAMFTQQGQSKYPEVFLRPKETINIPFRFLTFRANHSVQPQGPQDPFRQGQRAGTLAASEGTQDDLLSRVIKVLFKITDGRILAVLIVKVEPQPHVIDQIFRFHHPEQSFLKKSIRLPPMHRLPGAPVGGDGQHNQLFIRCSDPNAICDGKSNQAGETLDVFLKVSVGASPEVKKFFVAIYTNPFLSQPVQVWQFYIHAQQRVDISCVEGQTSRFCLILRGTHTSRFACCFTSHPKEMQLQPNQPFVLAAGTVHELHVAVRPMQIGTKFFYINVVDSECHQLLRTWLVCVNCRGPIVSRAFELDLPVGGGRGNNKRITYTNPYKYKKTFLLRCNRDDLLQFKETRIEIGGGQSYTLGLRFAPATQPLITEILVFINDENDRNEETFCIKLVYSLAAASQ